MCIINVPLKRTNTPFSIPKCRLWTLCVGRAFHFLLQRLKFGWFIPTASHNHFACDMQRWDNGDQELSSYLYFSNPHILSLLLANEHNFSALKIDYIESSKISLSPENSSLSTWTVSQKRQIWRLTVLGFTVGFFCILGSLPSTLK